MHDANFKRQSEFYNHGYDHTKTGDAGFPDLKIVDYDALISGNQILNVGGGDCSDLWFLASQNVIEVVDGSSIAVERAHTHGIAGQVGDVAQPLPYADKTFDIVVLKDILEHVYDSMSVLLEAKRVLADNGYLVISLPNHFYLPFRFRLLCGGNLIWKSLMHNHKISFEEWNYMHIRFFTWTGVKKMMKTAGLRIEKAYWDFGTLAHYSDPLMYEHAFTLNKKEITTKRQWLLYKICVPLFKIFNLIIPKWVRSRVVSIAPGLLCAGFYLRVRKNPN